MVCCFRKRSMAEEDSTSGLDLGHNSGLADVFTAKKNQSTLGSGDVSTFSIKVVLHDERNAMKRSTGAGFGALLVESSSI
jgi:hypothetical protein